MRRILIAGVVLLLFSTAAFAGPITLTFEGLQNLEPVNDYYNGGTGGFGSGPGTNYGISFTSDSLAVVCLPGVNNCSSAPSPVNALFFLSGAGDTMNVAAGFTTGFSFFYAATFIPGSVDVYSGLDGTGTLLAHLDLAPTGSGCDGQTGYSCWVPVGVSFAGTAESAVFGGSANFIAFDNITLGSATPGGSTPEPASMVLFGSGLIGIARKLRKLV